MKVAFIGIDLNNDLIAGYNGNIISTPVTVMQFITSTKSPLYGLERDMDGNMCIVVDKPEYEQYTLDVDNGSTVNRISNVEFIGSRPPVVR